MSKDLIDCIAFIKAEQAKLPVLDMQDYHASHARRDAAIALMVSAIEAALPKVRIVGKWDGAKVSIAGIRASSTSGVDGALSNWIAAARRRLDQSSWISGGGKS